MRSRLFGSGWDIETVAAPWGERPSVYAHVAAHIAVDAQGDDDGEPLPDEALVRGESGIGWMAGALDGAFGHHGGDNDSKAAATEIFDALRSLVQRSTDERAARLYLLLTAHSALQYVDPLLEAVVADERLDPERLYAVVRWLAEGAADREPVKAALALLGVVQGSGDRELLMTLGRHEEFTLYAAVALQNTEENPEQALWALARSVHGWGRIQIIERLAGTTDEEIKSWLLREGYRNSIMDEYTSLVCAETGDLVGGLRESEPDAKLLKGAGAILSALIRGRGGPSEGIDAYPAGAEAADLYLRRLRARDLDLEAFNSVIEIERFLMDEESEARDPLLGWTERRDTLLDHIRAIRTRPDWREKIEEGLASDDSQEFWTATEAARALDMDIWDVYFERLRRGEDHWYFVMQTGDPERIRDVVRLAEERLPLTDIAAGPAEELGLGSAYKAHSALDFVLQDLRRFPGEGWALIRAGLRSPVVRNRNMAVRALAAWERPRWNAEAEPLLRRALAEEPNAETAELMRKALAGEGTEDLAASF